MKESLIDFPLDDDLDLLMGGLPQKSRLGIYVHVPFCPHICPYCDFTKTSAFSKRDTDAFFSHALTQLDALIELAPEKSSHCTLYFGGGTPGLFGAKAFAPFLARVKERFTVEECTLETNPFTNQRGAFDAWAAAGIDRLTLGAQSLCPRVLKALGRKHTPDDVLKNIAWARAAGFSQVQIDLIYGLRPGLRSRSVSSEVETLIAAGGTGISGYALTLEERTAMRGSNLAHDDTAADEFEELHAACASRGLAHLETSNFSFYEAMHNNIYWYGAPYLGIGTGAHGLLPPRIGHPYGLRYRVGRVPKERAQGDDDLPFAQGAPHLFALEYEETRTRERYLDEMVFTLLRTPHGLPAAWLRKYGGEDVLARMDRDPKIAQGRERGSLTLDDEGLRLAWREKIRGDAWALHICGFIETTK